MNSLTRKNSNNKELREDKVVPKTRISTSNKSSKITQGLAKPEHNIPQRNLKIDHLNSSCSSSSSLNGLNEDHSYYNLDQIGVENMASDLTNMNHNNYQTNEIIERLNNQSRSTNSNIKHSEIYKEVVNSLLNEKLITYSKQYDLFMNNTNDLDKSLSNDEIGSLNENNTNNQIRFEKRNTFMMKNKKLLSNANLVKSALKPIRLANTAGSSRSSLNQDYTEIIKLESKKSRPNTSTNFARSNSSCFNRANMSSSCSINSNLKSLKSVESNPNLLPRVRLTDLVFEGYQISITDSKKKKMSLNVDLSDDNDEEDEDYDDLFQDEEDSKDLTNENVNYLTPSFKIKRYNTNDLRQLELAKQDIYKRYAFINDSNMRARSTLPINLTVKSKLFSNKNKNKHHHFE